MAEYIKRKALVDLVLGKLKFMGDARIMNENDEKVLSEIDGYEKAMCAVHELILDNDLIEDIQPVKRELVKIVDLDFMTQGYLTIEKFYSCPRCGETFGNVRFSRRSQLAEMYKYCYKCGQWLDWAEATKG